MIRTLLRVAWLSLSRDRVAQALTFLLPIMFFTIFANVFGRQGFDSTSKLSVAVVDEARTDFSRRLVRALEKDGSLRVRTRTPLPRGVRDPAAAARQPLLDRARAEAMVKNGDPPVALVIPPGAEVSFGPRDSSAAAAIEILSDPSDPVAPQVLNGVLQKNLMTASPGSMMKSGMSTLERYGGPLTPEQRRAMDQAEEFFRADTTGTAIAGGDSASSGDTFRGLVPVKVVKVLGEKRDNPMISFYAAGIAIMFLLFSCSAGAGALLDEADAGTLDRVLTTRVGMTGLLAGKWIFLTLLGVAQITVMFLYAMVAFGLPFLRHLPGFAVMAPVSAATVAAFGLVLATSARTRQQLGGISTIVILAMSALGGSMFPRFLMSPGMQRIGLLTPNAWALDGFVKVFWRDARIFELWPQVAMLLGFTALFLGVARMMARRWETV